MRNFSQEFNGTSLEGGGLGEVSRRSFLRTLAGTAGAAVGGQWCAEAAKGKNFAFRYILSSAMYGTTELSEILPEVSRIGAREIDIWPRKHGDQREQVESMGPDAFGDLLEEHGVRLGCLTRYDLGPFGLDDEMTVANRLGCKLIITGPRGPKGLAGKELKSAVRDFVKSMEPHVAVAKENGVTIAVENHGNSLIQSAESMKYFAEFAKSPHLGIAFAPHHLPQDGVMQGELIADLGEAVAFFYAQQHGMGSKGKLPKEQELLQMPGRGALDFRPLVEALKQIGYAGFTEIFMHPVPRGIPILNSTSAVTSEINRSRAYLDGLIDAAS